MESSGNHLKNETQHTPDDELLAAELRDAFGLEAGASGFEVDLGSSSGGGSSARFTGFKRRKRHRPGSHLGDFEILEELGRGGMGIVYRARQISLDREVALKVLPEYGHRGPMAIQRFKTEARAAARLQHTNIVPVYAQGEDNGTFYYAMEYIRGASLDTAIRCRSRLLSPSNISLAPTPKSNLEARIASETAILASTDAGALAKEAETATKVEPLPEDVRKLHRERRDFCYLARLLSEVATAVQHAHEAGVVHRDLKPQNLLVGTDERLHITDFGLARLMDEPGLTMPGELMGTPAYLAPEQARADVGAIDERTDIYALGVTLYELLTLNRPFHGETREQILSGIKEREPAPPRSFDDHIPNDLQTICLKAMEKDPARRYATAEAMAEDLRRFADGRPILSRPAGPITRTIKWARRHKALSTAICSIFVVLVLASGLAASVMAGRKSEADALVDDVYERLVYFDYRATQAQLDTLDRAEELGGDTTRIAELRALAMLFRTNTPTSRPDALAITESLVDSDDADADVWYLHALALNCNDRMGEALSEWLRKADQLGRTRRPAVGCSAE
jgi:serine/threonine protein kinase